MRIGTLTGRRLAGLLTSGWGVLEPDEIILALIRRWMVSGQAKVTLEPAA